MEISTFQKLMDKTYGEKDGKRGAYGIGAGGSGTSIRLVTHRMISREDVKRT